MSETVKIPEYHNLVQQPDDGSWMLLLFLVVAIAGAIGGCSGAAHVFLVSKKELRIMQLLAYSVLGVFMSIVGFGALSAYNSVFDNPLTLTVSEMIGFSLVLGFAGSLALSGTNILISWTTKHFGKLDIQFTVRKKEQDRRK